MSSHGRRLVLEAIEPVLGQRVAPAVPANFRVNHHCHTMETGIEAIRLRNAVIVLFSIFFFAWGDLAFVWYVIAGTWIDYMIIKHVLTNPAHSEGVRKGGVVIAILINVGALLFFKYANFFVDQVQPLMQLAGMERPSWYGVALPLGISFIAFHKISFVVDLYKQRTAPPASFIDALLYILFFPQLIAGPIVRYHEISQQIRVRTHETGEFIAGFFRFARGLGKKALIGAPRTGRDPRDWRR